MKLSELVRGLPALSGDLGRDPEVSGVRHDSRRVAAGDLFVAWSGARHDGAAFGADAIARGAVAVISDRPRPEGLAPEVPWLVAAEPRALLGPLAAPLHGHPDRDLVLVGVTGTNGKSTTVELVAAMLDAAGRPAGRIGTLGYRFPGLDAPEAERTTPEASELFRLLATMRRLGARAAAMEVSSHALVQGRVAGVGFDVGLFTNLTRDHLDFHRDLEDYFAAKSRLFDQLKPGGRAVVPTADDWGRRLAERLPGALSFGPGGAVAAVTAELDTAGIRGELATPRGALRFRSPLLGRYNLDNLLAAAAAAEALELPHEAIAAAIAATRPLPGRMEPVEVGQSFPVVVDYAHTDAALEAAIRALREISGRRVVVVFGCGGDRDPGKRPLMGRVAGSLADLPIVTSDNPRTEDPLAIIAAVEQGLRASGNRHYRVVPDRREAIRRALAVAAQGGYAVLVAGKGHEREQIVGTARLPFSDRDEIERALADRRAEAGG
ncbi:MAG: UDP-N-acetylmuramoyl-L-alanyl-D-glutamate--2,6-diaminopimelate ligase [Acidobacteria bacterium]|nr:UDP-N-acetylmuramoyl-L-alanyl-D-glutamate--2,6-diaminopimelate ligase [Acidobacteriota bacterium]